MESLQNIKRRIKSVHNVNQITKAMELVAATKMRKSQEIAIASRPYAFAALDLLAKLSNVEALSLSPLLETRKVNRTALVLVTSDKGLAGSFNGAVIREFEKYMARINADQASARISADNQRESARYSFIAVGQKANAHLQKRTGGVREKFVRVGDYTTVSQVSPIANLLTQGFIKKEWDEVIVFSTHFKTALRQVVLTRKILPVDVPSLKATAEEMVPETGRFAELIKGKTISFFNGKDAITSEYLIEPSPEIILKELIPHLVMMQIYHLVLEANASEHAARRVAMKSASDNASELAESLTVVYNKSRQASITRELIEITAGAEALES